MLGIKLIHVSKSGPRGSLSYWKYDMCYIYRCELEQLERLRSEDTPAASWLPTLLSHIGSQVNRKQSQSYKFKEFTKISNILVFTHDTPSDVAWYDVQIWNGSDEYCWRYRADTILSTDGQMDRRTDGRTDRCKDGQDETTIPPLQLCWSEGYNDDFYYYCRPLYWKINESVRI